MNYTFTAEEMALIAPALRAFAKDHDSEALRKLLEKVNTLEAQHLKRLFFGG